VSLTLCKFARSCAIIAYSKDKPSWSTEMPSTSLEILHCIMPL
jgi:hypothetical protein